MRRMILALLAGFFTLAMSGPAFATGSPSPSASTSSSPSPSASSSTSASPSASVSTKPNAQPPCAAYLYFGTRTNLCDKFPGMDRDDVKCSDVRYRVALVNKNIDPWGLDGSGGGDRGIVGLGCESWPRKPITSPSPSRSTSTSPVPAGVAEPALPVTGPSIGLLIGAGVVVLVGGAAVVYLTGRRKKTFTA